MPVVHPRPLPDVGLYRWRTMAALALACATGAAGCSGNGDGDASPGFQGTITTYSGDAQQGPVASALPIPIAVEVLGVGGADGEGSVVDWAVASGGGSLASATTTVEDNNRTANTWTLGSAPGGQTVTASVRGSIPFVSTTFTATAVGAEPPPATCSAQFGETDWMAPAWDVVVVSSDGAASQSISLANTGGNPSGPTFGGLENPSFRKMLHTMDLATGTSGTSRITVAQFPVGGTYNPSGLVKFVYREDQIIVSNLDALPVTWGFALRQGGTVFLAPLGTFNSPTWQRQQVDVTPASFTAPGPDLTQPFEVGFFRSTTTAANPAAGSTVEHGIDNWQIETCQ